MKFLFAVIMLIGSYQPIVEQRTVKVKLDPDGHWYPVNEKEWEWFGRLDGGKPNKPMSINDPSTWPTILNF